MSVIWKEDLAYWKARTVKAEAKIERLQTALKEIQETEWAIGPMTYREIARHALEEK